MIILYFNRSPQIMIEVNNKKRHIRLRRASYNILHQLAEAACMSHSILDKASMVGTGNGLNAARYISRLKKELGEFGYIIESDRQGHYRLAKTVAVNIDE